jgi:DNA-binding MarR family transcriptional regulator
MNNPNLADQEHILQAFETAKETLNLLPQLPIDLKLVHIQVLIAIYRIRDQHGCTRITDISNALKILLPNATTLVNELVNLKILEKISSMLDKRVVLVRTTEIGEGYLKDIKFFHERLDEELSKISESKRRYMIETINQIYRITKRVVENIKDEEVYRKS